MIGILDSGIGGVTVMKEIIKVLPNEKYIYYSDSKNNPYGDKTEDELYDIVNNIVKFLISNGCSIIVLACNTASAVCVGKLRKEYENIIFIAIEPAYKMVHDYNFSGKTLVMATKATLGSKKFIKLYDKYNNDKTILKPCPGLAELIENDNKKEIDLYLQNQISKYKGVDNVVLGCTHYPLIKDRIEKVLGKVNFYDGAHGLSLELKRQLEKNKLIKESGFFMEFYDSCKDKIKEERFEQLLNT